MTTNDMKYIDNYGSELLIKNMPLNELVYTDAFDGDAKYHIYFATENHFAFIQAWDNNDGTLRIDDTEKEFGYLFSIKKDNVMELSLDTAYEGVCEFTHMGEVSEIIKGTAAENDFEDNIIDIDDMTINGITQIIAPEQNIKKMPTLAERLEAGKQKAAAQSAERKTSDIPRKDKNTTEH